MRVFIPKSTFAGLMFCLLAIAVANAQGPASCGYHLDIIADGTSTHSAIADAPHAPGALGGYPPGAPGNPYQAYASPGTTIKLRLSVPAGTLGPTPIGSGSRVTILYSIGTPFIPMLLVPGIVPPCQLGQPIIVTVFPWTGGIVDGVGFFALPPPVPPADPGHPYKLEVSLLFPPMPMAAPIQLQAVLVDPTGMIAISNGVSLLPGPNPNESSLMPTMMPCGPFPIPDEGYTPIPTPPGFTFYGIPQPTAQVITNGFLEFSPFGVGPAQCDWYGTPGDLGCNPPTPTASPRVAVNHYDCDYSLPPPMPRVGDITIEFAPPFPGLPTRHIVRWKNGPPLGSPAPFPDTDYASHVCELWGDDVPNQPLDVLTQTGLFVQVDGRSRVVVVRQEIHALTTTAIHAQLGIGPGPLAGAPPPCTPMPFWTLWGFPAWLTVPFEAVHMDPATMGPWYPQDSHTMTNLTMVCDPPLLGPGPGVYAIQVY